MNTYTESSAKSAKSGHKNAKTSTKVEDDDVNHANMEVHVECIPQKTTLQMFLAETRDGKNDACKQLVVSVNKHLPSVFGKTTANGKIKRMFTIPVSTCAILRSEWTW
jgi:hypothetical protein